MFGGGNQPRPLNDIEPSSQLPITPRQVIISDPSATLNNAGPTSANMFLRENTQNGLHSQQVDLAIIHSKKLQDDLQELGHKIKHHEENVKYLRIQKSKLEESVLDMKGNLEKCISSFSATQNQDHTHLRSEEEILSHVLKYEKSAAALLCLMKRQSSDHPLTKDVIGIVASLGKVENDNLSRLLSEFLGTETMLAVVCKSYEGVKALEAYDNEGSINKNLGLHAFSASTGRPLDDPFLVICLESLRPYPGEFIADDPQRRLDLLKPKLINGETPPGFLGYAVNMISIEKSLLYCNTRSGLGLRETLFYNLFSRLQVYRSRDDMLKALPYITDGAVSLDGGTVKSSGVFCLGPRRRDMDVKFPIGSEMLNPPDKYFEIENKMKETRWKSDRMGEDLQREQTYLEYSRAGYEKKKREFVQFLAESSVYSTQVGRSSTPR